ncbi:hypothetical protein [Lewinella sp. IMCC34183]|uniref:hypothetical protein n=1 Tax=Lewinella sp. IMCC34183 TaxID=2248762 RepID=UPI000E224DCC|nr:hypothetical protein [Lewinella sp. IMCC34183]
MFSSLNYAPLESTVGEVRAGAGCTVTLRPTPYDLTGVEVRAEKIDFNTKTLGVPPPGRFSRTGYNHSGRGSERGVAIANDERCRLRDINLFVSNVNIDSFRVEFNLYAYAGGSVGEPLQRERIFATIRGADANSSFQVPLEKRNLFIDGPFIASVMMLDDHSDAVIMLEASPKKKYKGYRRHADGRWLRQDISPSISVVMKCPE